MSNVRVRVYMCVRVFVTAGLPLVADAHAGDRQHGRHASAHKVQGTRAILRSASASASASFFGLAIPSLQLSFSFVCLIFYSLLSANTCQI